MKARWFARPGRWAVAAGWRGRLLVPAQNTIVEDGVQSWQAGPNAPILFQVTVPQTTLPGDVMYIQFNPYGWTPPIPMWNQGNNLWGFKLYGPLNIIGSFGYRYCRNAQCDSADDVQTPGADAHGRNVSPTLTAQDIVDTVNDWTWAQKAGSPTLVATTIPSRGTGFMENPYKTTWLFGAAPGPATTVLADGTGLFGAHGQQFIEQRPDVRNQWNWTLRWVQYVEPTDGALHLDYQFARDDWGIKAHTIAAEWVQPLGAGWSLAPRVRYYSQSSADFYRAYFVVKRSDVAPTTYQGNPDGYVLPGNFSSDQRLSGYGTLSGGVTLSKQVLKGVGLETGFEYYTHQGSLKLGGGGEQGFADFDYWVANAALKFDLSSLGQGAYSDDAHANHTQHPEIPAGVLFGHTLDKAGDMMVAYRYQRNQQGGRFLHGTTPVSNTQVESQACPGLPRRDVDRAIVATDGPCPLLPQHMAMNMHMLELMVAATDRVTLMVMPQFMNMEMPLFMPTVDADTFLHVHSHPGHIQIGRASCRERV